jgi:hypothetical protein
MTSTTSSSGLDLAQLYGLPRRAAGSHASADATPMTPPRPSRLSPLDDREISILSSLTNGSMARRMSQTLPP